MNFINRLLFRKQNNSIESVYEKFLNSNKNMAFGVLFKKHFIGMIERTENLNQLWFEENLIKIDDNSDFFLTISIPKEKIKGLNQNFNFKLNNLLDNDEFLLIESSEEFTGLGRFCKLESNKYLTLDKLLETLKEIFEIEQQDFIFDLFKTDRQPK
jgi:hypothetical protein